MNESTELIIDDKSYLASFTMEGLSTGIPNQRVYLKNLGFLTGKRITGARFVGAYIAEDPNFGNGNVLNNVAAFQLSFAINMCRPNKELTISNLPLTSMLYFNTAYRQRYTKFDDVYDFDNSWIEKFSTVVVPNMVLFVEFFYRDL